MLALGGSGLKHLQACGAASIVRGRSDFGAGVQPDVIAVYQR